MIKDNASKNGSNNYKELNLQKKLKPKNVSNNEFH